MTDLKDSSTLKDSNDIRDMHVDSTVSHPVTVQGFSQNENKNNSKNNHPKSSESEAFNPGSYQDDINMFGNNDAFQLEKDLFNQYLLDPDNIKTSPSMDNNKLCTTTLQLEDAILSPSDLANLDIQNQNISVNDNNDNIISNDEIFNDYMKPENVDISPSDNKNNNSSHQFISRIRATIPSSNNVNSKNCSVDSSTVGFGGTTISKLFLTKEKKTKKKNNKNKPNKKSLSKNKTTLTSKEQEFQTFIIDTLSFGRTKNITSAPIDPTKYFKLDESTLSYKLTLQGLPRVTRAENQLKLSLILSPLIADKYLIYLPIDSIIRERFYLQKDITTYPKDFQEQLLYLDVFVLDKVTNESIQVCKKCVIREQRRASRRKSKVSDNLLWCNNRNKKAIIFNNKQISPIEQIDSNHKMIQLTARIVCYCRHQKAEEGFKLLFVIKDFMGNVLAKTVSDPIVVTDSKQQIMELGKYKLNNKKINDSKSPILNDILVLSNSATYERLSNIPDNANSIAISSMNFNESTTSNSTTSGHYFDSLDDPFESGNIFDNVNHNLSTTKQTQNFINQYQNHQNFSYLQQSQFNNNNNMIHCSLEKRIIPSPISMSEDSSKMIATELLYKQNNDPNFKSLASLNSMYGNSKKRPRINMSNVVNPNNLRRQYSVNIQNTLKNTSDCNFQQQQRQQLNLHMTPIPFIQRVIPSNGPISGGIEVTLLGSNFREGLIVKFGNNVALSTHCWSETTILTYLPPAMSAGQVLVTIYDPNRPEYNTINNNITKSFSQGMDICHLTHPSQKAIFTYIDESDRQLIELALQIVGLKMNGKLEDVKNIAKKIVDDDSRNLFINQDQSINVTNTNTYSTLNNSTMVADDEQLIIKVIQSLNNTTSNLSMCNGQGRTLLHLAALKGYLKLSSILIKAGVYVDRRDMFGFTPLHFAAISGKYKVIRLLLTCHSNSLTLTNNGITARRLYEENHMFDPDYQNVIGTLEYYMDLDIPSAAREMSRFNFDPSIPESYSKLSMNTGEECIEGEQGMLDEFSSFKVVSDSGQGYEQHEDEFSLSAYSSMNYSSDFDDDEIVSDLFTVSMTSSIGNIRPFVCTTLNVNDIDLVRSNNIGNTNNNYGSISSWNKLLTRIDEDLPKYEDLYPRNWINSKSEDTTNSTMEISKTIKRTRRSSETITITLQVLSEDDTIPKILNQFFQTNILAIHKDKMLFFFWLPLMTFLLVWVLWSQFGRDNNNNTINKVNGLVQHYVAMGLAKVVLGNQRMKTIFRNSISNFQTPGILNDLIVG